MNSQPPKYFLRFFRWFCHPRLQKPVEGDLMELYQERVKELGKKKADRQFIKDVLLLFRKDIIKPTDGTYRLNNYGMFKNYFKVGYRNLIRNKSHGFINIGGLSIAMTVVILISLWITDELSFNHNHKEHQRTAKVLKKRTLNGDTQVRFALPIPIVDELDDNYRDDLKNVTVAAWQGSSLVDTKDKQLNLIGNYMSANAPKLLDLDMKAGSHESLSEKFSVMVSVQAANSLFDSEDVIGKQLIIDGEVTMNITGVYKDLPSQSSFHGLSFIGNFEGYASTQDWIQRAIKNRRWDSNFCQVFVQLQDNASWQSANKKIEKLIYNNSSDRDKQNNPIVFLHPMDDWHLRSNWENGEQTGGAILYVWLFGVIAVFILFLACINFMNLSTAQAEKRAKEVGIRKSLGSLRSQLIGQFLIESFLIVSLSFVISVFLVNIVLPYFNMLSGKQMNFPFSQSFFWLSAALFIAFTSLVSASYPAFYLSGFRPVKVLKGTFKTGRASAVFRRILVVGQFAVSITLIAGTFIVYQQINHSKNRPIGYDAKNLLSVRSSPEAFRNKHHVIQDELLKTGAVISMSQSSSPLTELNSSTGGFSWEGKDPDLKVNFVFSYVTHEFGKTVGWNIRSGRDFKNQKSDEKAYVINQAAADFIGLTDPVGKSLAWYDGPHKIIGVVDNLILESPFQQIEPAIYTMNMEETEWMQIKLAENQPTAESIARVEEVFQKIMPNVPFGFEFISSLHGEKFASISQVGNLSSIFTFLAIFISSLGLFGLASYVVERKTKEIGIRKVLGAKASRIVLSLSLDFAKMVIIASIIAVPISYIVGHRWLESFAYRINLEWWYFALAGFIALIIAGITVSSKTIQAATANPVKSLKDE
ncbi:FtsX-like permease family protein [Ekhidna sp.]